jgi:uncharacterized membrane protein
MRRHFWFLTTALLVALLATMLPALVRDALLGRYRWLGIATLAGTALLNVVVLLGVVSVSLRIHDTDYASLTDLVDGADQVLAGLVTVVLLLMLMIVAVLPLVSVSLLTVIISLLSPSMVPVVLVGLSALAVLALYSLSRYVFCVHLVVDLHLGPLRALRASDDLTRQVRGRTLGLVVLMMVLNLAGAATVGVGLLVSLPLSLLTLTAAYRQVVPRGRTTQGSAREESSAMDAVRRAPGELQVGTERF